MIDDIALAVAWAPLALSAEQAVVQLIADTELAEQAAVVAVEQSAGTAHIELAVAVLYVVIAQ